MDTRTILSTLAMAVLMALGAAACQRPAVQAAREKTDDPKLTARQILSMDEESFLINAEKTVIRQKTLAMTALEKSQDPDVREFAGAIVVDRNRDLDVLMNLLKKYKVAEAPALAEEDKLEAANRLHRLSGNAFDHEFISLMAAEQQQAVADFRNAAETAGDPAIRSYAGAVLALLRKDLDTAVALEKKLAQADRK